MLVLSSARLFSLLALGNSVEQKFIIKPALELKVISVYQQLSVIHKPTDQKGNSGASSSLLEANRSLEAIPQSKGSSANQRENQIKQKKGKLITSQVLRSLI